ncbi:DUF2884 family protein [candidate division GN15 bacterium]|nr:DUF2884 family protein [candidate division GN15 bacterium]
MRRIAVVAIALLFVVGSLGAADERTYNYHIDKCDYDDFGSHHWSVDENVTMDFDDGTIVFESRDYPRDVVEITERYELLINGEPVELTADQQRHVREFHQATTDLIADAIAVGIEGADIGMEGAAIGVKAAGQALKALFTGHTFEDMEREIEREARKIEVKAEKLEEKADQIDRRADHIEDMYFDMFEEIPALRDLGWH